MTPKKSVVKTSLSHFSLRRMTMKRSYYCLDLKKKKKIRHTIQFLKLFKQKKKKKREGERRRRGERNGKRKVF